MRHLKIIFISLLLLAWSGIGIADSAEVMALFTLRIKPYQDALEGFKAGCGCVPDAIDVSETSQQDLKEKIRAKRPSLLFVVGMETLEILQYINDIPIVYAMVLNAIPFVHGEGNITGVSLEVPSEKHFEALKNISPEIKRLGMAFDPRNSTQYLEQAWVAAKSNGITLVARRVYEPPKAPGLIKEMLGMVDAYWMLPDLTMNNPATVKFLMDFSMANNIPIITFSDKFVGMGALMALTPDSVDMGRQAGEMAHQILSGTKAGDIPPASPRKIGLMINLETARKMGITFNADILQRAGVIK